MNRWINWQQKLGEDHRVDEFLGDIVSCYKKHGMSLSPGTSYGLKVESYVEENVSWLFGLPDFRKFETIPFCDGTSPIDWEAKYTRALADLTNLQRQTANEVERANKQGQDKTLNALLPVLDSLERAMRSSEEGPVEDALFPIVEQFNGVLSALGVSRIACSWQKFDPAIHDAIQQEEVRKELSGVVLNEAQAGYIHKDGRLIRAAKVVVGK